jgi:hypothetical protein
VQEIGDSSTSIHHMIREHIAEMDIEAFMQWMESREAEDDRPF